MDFLFWYGLFALTTALAAVYELVIPVLNKEQTLKGTVENYYIYYVVFIPLFIITAPLVFLMTVVPNFGESFRNTLHNSLFPKV